MWFMWLFMSDITVNQNHSSFFISVLHLYKRSAYKLHKKSFCLATNCSYRVIRHQSIVRELDLYLRGKGIPLVELVKPGAHGLIL